MAVFSRRSKKRSETSSEGRSQEEQEEGEQRGEDTEQFSLQTLDVVKTIGTGTFARVCLCRHSTSRR